MPDAIRAKILVIEDDPDTRANLCDILELDDYGVLTAATVSEALQRDDFASISAVILDRKLPDGSAEEALPQLKRLAPAAAVLIVTGHADLDGAIAAIREGAEDYILKPVNPDSLRLSLARIRERQKLSEQKSRSEAAFRHLVEAAGCMIVILRRDRTVAYFNPFAEDLTGYSASEVVGKDYFDIFLLPDDRQGVADSLERVFEGTPARDYENRVRCRHGAARWVMWNAQRLDEFEGEAAVLAVGQDITQRQLAEERALQTERLAAIGQTVAGLAHESRNAFQRSQACLELLALEVEDNPSQLQLVSRIQRALDHLHRLYEEVRDYAAPIKLDRKMCDLARLWRDAWSHLDVVRDQKKVRLQEEIDLQLDLTCRVDWFAMGQVFRNVLENAIMACPEGGTIRIRCEPLPIHGKDAISVRVKDNGPGIPPEAREKVFDAFFTTKTKGTGLGMAIARRIVEAHGGRIAVGSPRSGAEFLIHLPRSS